MSTHFPDFCHAATKHLRSEGYDVEVTPGGLDAFTRFDRGGHMNGYYKVNAWGEGFVVSYGDFKTGEKGIYKSEAAKAMTAAEVTELHAKAEAWRLEEQERAAKECRELWAALPPPVGLTHPYLKKKQLQGPFGAKVECHAGTTVPMNLVIPLRNVQGDIVNLQRIGADGSKRFWPGAALKEACTIIGPPSWQNVTAILCEGWATGVTLHEATGLVVFCAMNASNMRAVAETLARDASIAQVVVCADNDWKNEPENAGEKAGLEAAAACGGLLISPRKADLGAKGSDFNDMAAVRGLDAVRDYILGEITRLETTNGNESRSDLRGQSAGRDGQHLGEAGGLSGAIESSGGGQHSGPRVQLLARAGEMLSPPRQKGVPRPSESAIADAVANSIRPFISVFGEIYKYTGTHWETLPESKLLELRQKILKDSGNVFKSRDVESCMKAMHYFAEAAPGPEFFQPKANLANFLDGTLELIETPREAVPYRTEFRAHQKLDYLTNVIPLEYKKARDAGPGANPEFLAMLERIFGECEDKTERIRAVRQMFGACLLPLFPRLFMLHGPGGSGKSSLVMLAMRLVSDKNYSMVDPQDFNGFHLESMIGKLVNVVTDIDTTFAIKDGIIKKIEDRVPFHVNRKFKKAIPAPIPAVHIFGANKIPRTMDGESGAHTRRWSFIELPYGMVAGANYSRDFVNRVWETSPEGILAFALEGLDDLITSKGKFFNPSSGVERLAEWQLESDWIGQFLSDISEGEHEKLTADPEGLLPRHDMWDAFHIWFEQSHPSMRHMGKIFFYRGLRQKGIAEKTTNGVRHFMGYRTSKPGDKGERAGRAF